MVEYPDEERGNKMIALLFLLVTCISQDDERRHRFVSGANDKETRAFHAPLATLHLLDKLHSTNDVFKSKEIENNQPNIERLTSWALLEKNNYY